MTPTAKGTNVITRIPPPEGKPEVIEPLPPPSAEDEENFWKEWQKNNNKAKAKNK